MSPHEPFIRTILENLHHSGPRLVYADWLEEQGDPLAATVRLLDAFVQRAQGLVDEGHKSPLITIMDGPVYWRIVKHERKMDGTLTDSRSVYCLIRKADGAVMKAAGWKKPAPNGVRCYLDREETLKTWMTSHGMAYCR